MGLLFAPAPAHGDGVLLQVWTNPSTLRFDGLEFGDRVEFLATVHPLGSGPIELSADVVARDSLFAMTGNPSAIDITGCSGTWTLAPGHLPRAACQGTARQLLASTQLVDGAQLDFQLPVVEPGKDLTVRIGVNVGDHLETPTKATKGAATFHVIATDLSESQGPGNRPGSGGAGDGESLRGFTKNPLAPTGLDLDLRLVLALIALGSLACAFAARRSRR